MVFAITVVVKHAVTPLLHCFAQSKASCMCTKAYFLAVLQLRHLQVGINDIKGTCLLWHTTLHPPLGVSFVPLAVYGL